jgi:hypothetical protein
MLALFKNEEPGRLQVYMKKMDASSIMICSIEGAGKVARKNLDPFERAQSEEYLYHVLGLMICWIGISNEAKKKLALSGGLHKLVRRAKSFLCYSRYTGTKIASRMLVLLGEYFKNSPPGDDCFQVQEYISYPSLRYLLKSVFDIGQKYRTREILEKYLTIFQDAGNTPLGNDDTYANETLWNKIVQDVLDYEWEEIEDSHVSSYRYPDLNQIASEAYDYTRSVKEDHGHYLCFPSESLFNLIGLYRHLWREDNNERVLKVLEDVIDYSLNRVKSTRKRKRKTRIPDPTYQKKSSQPRSQSNAPWLIASLVAPHLSALNRLGLERDSDGNCVW